MDLMIKSYVDELEKNKTLSREQFKDLIKFRSNDMDGYIFERAVRVCRDNFSNNIYMRAVINMSNYCRNNCLYCGIRRDMKFLQHFRMDKNEIMDCCDSAYQSGFRTFVLSGGNDLNYSSIWLSELIHDIKDKYPDCAVTLNLGERAEKDYIAWKSAGADRYLLDEVTAAERLYKKLHPSEMSPLCRKQCLWQLKDAGYQVEAGFLVGLPFQIIDDIVEDLLFLKQLSPQSIDIGAFVPANGTAFEKDKGGNPLLVLYLTAVLRLMFPNCTILNSLSFDTNEREGCVKGIMSGANAFYFDFTPLSYQDNYHPYNMRTGKGKRMEDSFEGLKQQIEQAGYQLKITKGNSAVEDEVIKKSNKRFFNIRIK